MDWLDPAACLQDPEWVDREARLFEQIEKAIAWFRGGGAYEAADELEAQLIAVRTELD